jgi:hypothetical protein
MCNLPTEHDFDPYGGDLDAQCAWKDFGGLTLDEARRKFEENPDYYQEAFAFMGGKAFAYYYPVIDGYLRETSPAADNCGDDRQVWILAYCIGSQFQVNTMPYVRPLKQQVLDLAAFVLQNLDRFAEDTHEQRRIDAAWRELEALVRKI